MKINRVCILGGGFSGFVVSSILAKYKESFGLDFNIKVIYNKDIIGVGESSLFSINELFSYLGIEDSDWMTKCNATYKTSIRFENFYKKGRYFHYPFGPSRHDVSVQKWFTLKEFYPDVFTPERASLYFNAQSIFNEENKLCNNDDYLKHNAAYHFDSPLLAQYLKEYSEKRGVEVINDTFYGVEQDKYGNVESIVCDNGTYEADLFVDCSGFKSLLLGGVMGEDYIPFSDTLINNKALVAKIPYTDKEKQLKNYTNCVALDNGWCWEIPLWDGLSVGYVHTNKFATEEEVEKEFFKYVGEVDYRVVNFKTGRYKRGWVKNVVGLGLSYGFIEPLESTGIASTLENIFRLLECLSKRDMFYTQIDRDLFNHYVGQKLDHYRSFVEMHYFLSHRDDSSYWRYITENIDYDYGNDLKTGLWFNSYFRTGYQQFLDQMIVNRNLSAVFPDSNGNLVFTGTLFIVAGMNYSAYSKAFTLKNADKDSLYKDCQLFKEYLKGLEDAVQQYSSSYNYLRETLYKKTVEKVST